MRMLIPLLRNACLRVSARPFAVRRIVLIFCQANRDGKRTKPERPRFDAAFRMSIS